MDKAYGPVRILAILQFLNWTKFSKERAVLRDGRSILDELIRVENSYKATLFQAYGHRAPPFVCLAWQSGVGVINASSELWRDLWRNSVKGTQNYTEWHGGRTWIYFRGKLVRVWEFNISRRRSVSKDLKNWHGRGQRFESARAYQLIQQLREGSRCSPRTKFTKHIFGSLIDRM